RERARQRGLAADATELLNRLADAEVGVVSFHASTARQPSWEREEWGHGAFTKALVEALTGEAPGVRDPFLRSILDNDPLTHTRLHGYIAERVRQLTDGVQSPTYVAPSTVPDFPIARRR
ncbi:MAG: hypothetical protein N3B15_03260, partial [Planctomycetota bacterium]|nr:hypothetical protein [Planctomycetota bacterium]